MKNPVQTYAWGSHTAIAALLGDESPSTEPQAELWMGAHLKSPSRIFFENRWEPLSDLIDRYPNELLGREVAEKFGRSLPFLFKVLAAAEPLSIQAHPDAQQAVDGFQRENLKGLSLSDPQRNYRDDRPKPECLCALAPFTGLCGFRPPDEILTISAPVWPKDDAAALNIVRNLDHSKGLQEFFQSLMQMDKEDCAKLTGRVVENAAPLADQNEAYRWVCRLHRKYPGDIGVLSPLILNLVTLHPNEAVYLPPRQLHAYLDGIGIEVMGNSDNVLRGGLTPKHVDVPELTKILDFHSYKPEILTPQFVTETQGVYESPGETFRLTQLIVTSRRPLSISARFQGPEIILAIEGRCGIRGRHDQNDMTIEQGESVFIPAAVENYTISGDTRLFRAAVNLPTQEVKRQS
ncbi:MAG: mannose-6-phosphate isomerase, class I [Desulfobacteraceae bacterium]